MSSLFSTEVTLALRSWYPPEDSSKHQGHLTTLRWSGEAPSVFYSVVSTGGGANRLHVWDAAAPDSAAVRPCWIVMCPECAVLRVDAYAQGPLVSVRLAGDAAMSSFS